jgi:hypothetical protein
MDEEGKQKQSQSKHQIMSKHVFFMPFIPTPNLVPSAPPINTPCDDHK